MKKYINPRFWKTNWQNSRDYVINYPRRFKYLVHLWTCDSMVIPVSHLEFLKHKDIDKLKTHDEFDKLWNCTYKMVEWKNYFARHPFSAILWRRLFKPRFCKHK